MNKNGQELNATRIAQIETGRMALMDMQQELDHHRRQAADLTVEHERLRAELEAVRVDRARMMTELDIYRDERDRAVTRRAELEVVLDTVLTVLQRFQAPPSAQQQSEPEEESGAEQGQRH